MIDVARFNQLFSENYHFLVNYLKSRGRHTQQNAEDIAQETLLRAAKNMDTFHGEVRGWLFSVAKRISIDMHRARAARPLEAHFELSDCDGFTSDFEDRVVARVELQNAIRRMTPEYREIFILHYIYNYTYVEISEKLGIPVGTVKSREHYGRKAMQRDRAGS